MSENHDSRDQDQSADQLLEPHRALLERSKVSPETMKQRRYRSAESRKRLQELQFQPRQGNVPALIIPIHGVEGLVVTHLIRPDQPRSNKQGDKIKFELPKGHTLRIDVPAACRAAMADPGKELWIVDGPIQADAMASAGLTCIDVLGSHGWRHFLKRGREVLGDWKKIPLQQRTVITAFGSNIWASADSRADVGQFTRYLQSRGAKVLHALFPSGPNGERVAADDVLASGQDPKTFLADPLDRAFPYPIQDAGQWKEADRFIANPKGTFCLNYDQERVEQIPLANFSAQIINELRVTDGVDEHIEFEIEVHLHEKRSALTIGAEEFDGMGWPLKYLGAEAIIPAGYNVRDLLREAIQRFSGEVPKIPVFTHLGWVKHEGRWFYLHAGGVIGADSGPMATTGADNRTSSNSSSANGLDASGPKTPISEKKIQQLPIRVRVSSLFNNYRLPKPWTGKKMLAAVQATLEFLDLGPDKITMPLFAAPFRAVMDSTNFSLFLYGPSGTFKSELLLLVTQFFGPTVCLDDLRGWNSTANALAYLAFLAKNVVFPVDDFIPSGTRGDILHAHKQVDDLLRSQANRAGRHRSRGDGTVREGKPPRGLPANTGEMLPTGQSLNARLLAIPIEQGDVFDRDDPRKMECINRNQKWARMGCYARTMALFVEWLAPRYEEELKSLHEQKNSLREAFQEDRVHPRSVDIAADLAAGLDEFLFFAKEIGAIDEHRHESLWKRFHEAMWELLREQRDQLLSEDPTIRYLELLSSALHCGRAHLKLLHDDEKKDPLFGLPSLWGYGEKVIEVPKSANLGKSDPAPQSQVPNDTETEKYDEDGQGEDDQDPDDEDAQDDEDNGQKRVEGKQGDVEYKNISIPRGRQVGWKDYDNLYFDPEASLALVNLFARELALPEIPFSRKTLGKRLMDLGLIQNHGKDRNTLKCNIEGVRREVFHIRTNEFVDLHLPEEDSGDVLEEEQKERETDFAGRREARDRVLEERRRKMQEREMQEFAKALNLQPDE